MKYRESGMPNEEIWDTFFNPIEIINQMDINKSIRILLDIGCGYGTFLIPSAKIVSNTVVGIDIDSEMVRTCINKASEQNFDNIELIHGDISTEKTKKDLEKYKGQIDYITLFNILHCEYPLELLEASFQLLNKGGKIGIIHWKYEKTPRGPSMEIRPTPEIIKKWSLNAGFVLEKCVELPPYHYGMVFIKNR